MEKTRQRNSMGPVSGCSWFLFLLPLLSMAFLAGCGGGGGTGSSVGPATGTAQHSVGVRIDSTVAGGESFQFGMNGQDVTITQGNIATAFPAALAEGTAYTVNQLAGPRACTLSSSRTGTIGTTDVLVTADCGPAPVSHTVSVRIDSTVGASESFQFGMNAQTITITQGSVATPFATAVAEGTAYTVNQLAGPRACTLSSNRTGAIGTTDVLVTASCGNPPGTSALSGELRAPVGTSVTLRNNGGDDLALAMPSAGGDPYNVMPFSFAAALADGTGYAVTLASTPVNQTCSVYKGSSGTMPVAAGALKVGCEYTYDHVSRSTDNAVRGTYFNSTAPVIGGADVAVGGTFLAYGEGRFVAFVSSEDGLGAATGGFNQIYWRDRMTGATYLISTNASGTAGNNHSAAPAISADGLTVVFESYASNLVAGDTNGVRDVFVWSASNGSLERASVSEAGAEANAESFDAAVSGDGSIVAFSTSASNLTTGVTGNSTVNIVRRDLGTNTNTLVSRGSVGAGSGLGVGGNKAALSEDGNRLAFCSFSAQLTAGDGNGLWDIFVYQHDAGSMSRVSLASTGGERNQGNDSVSRVVSPAISGNGRYVAYATESTNVVVGDTNNAQDVFLVDLDAISFTVSRVSVSGGAEGNGHSPKGQGERPSLSYDGTWVAFSTMASNLGVSADNVVMKNTATGEMRAVSSATGNVGVPAMSRSSAYVVFGSNNQLDSRFANSGIFARFTNIARAWWWLD